MKRLVLILGVFLVCAATGFLPAVVAATDGDNYGPDRSVTGSFFNTSIYSVDELGEILAKGLVQDFLGVASLPTIISQPELPVELRPPGIPNVRPGRVPRPTRLSGEPLLTKHMSGAITKKGQPHLPQLLPKPEPEPGIVYVMPFTRVMVPDEVYEGLFDEFVDALNRQAGILGLQFVILKEGMNRVGPEWLSVHKYITGEIYAYVEDPGVNSTKISTKARVSYYHPKQKTPTFDTVVPESAFFDHNRSDIYVERTRLAEDIATTLTHRMLPEFDTQLIGKNSLVLRNDGA